MNLENLPAFVRESQVLDDGDRLQLSAFGRLPDEDEVDEIRSLPEVRDLLQAFIGDESTRNTHLQLKAKDYLQMGDVAMAWKTLLL